MNQFIDDVTKQIKPLRKLLHENANILLLTHQSCLDGVACQMVMQKYLPQTVVVKLSPNKIDDYVCKLTTHVFDAIVIADLSIKNFDFIDRSNVIMVDHHDTAKICHDPDNLSFVNTNYCGSKLLYTLLQMVFRKNIAADDFLNVVNDHDLWILKDKRSKILNALYYKYEDTAFIKRFRNLKPDINEEEYSWYDERMAIIIEKAKTVDLIELTDGVCIQIDNEYNNDLVHEILVQRPYDTIISYKPRFGGISMRSNREDIHVGELLQMIGGGGHKHAGGIRVNDDMHFKKCIQHLKTMLEPLPF